MAKDDAQNVRKERVLMVHNFYQIGGGEHTVFENETRLLRDNGHYLSEYTRHNDELKSSVIKKILLPFSSFFSIKTYNDVRRIIKNENIDIVHCHNTFPIISPSVYYAAWSCRVPVIQTIHNFRLMCPNGLFYRDGSICEQCAEKGLHCAVSHGCYRNSRLQTIAAANILRVHRLLGTYRKLRYIFLTDFNKNKYRTLLGDKVDHEFIKPNFEYVNIESSSTERDGSFVFIGRLDENKGIRHLVESWREIGRELYIFGEGALQSELTPEFEANEHIHFMGFQPHDVVFEQLKKSSALIFPSILYEGFPMTLIEAFALGTPVICSNIGNHADIVSGNKAGVLYDCYENGALEKAMQDIELNFEYYSRNARRAYEEQYTPQANYRILKSIYEKTVSENGK